MSHATLIKFGYPDTCVAEGAHWVVLLRPHQLTFGALVLCAKDGAITSLGELPEAAMVELGQMCRHIEQALRTATQYKKINYLALMMVDPHVHFHVVPRHDGPREFEGVTFHDAGWPGPPDFKSGVVPQGDVLSALKAQIVGAFSQVSGRGAC